MSKRRSNVDSLADEPQKKRRRRLKDKKKKRKHLNSWESDESDDSSSEQNHKQRSKHVKSKEKSKDLRDKSNNSDNDNDNETGKNMSKENDKDDGNNRNSISAFGYTNEKNPFNDSNLEEAFVWGKQLKQEAQEKGISKEKMISEYKAQISSRRKENAKEIHATKLRRLEREENKEADEKMKEELARQMELEQNVGWQEKEEAFHLKNAIKKCQIRMRQYRSEPIDYIARCIHQFNINDDDDNNTSNNNNSSSSNKDSSGVNNNDINANRDPIKLINNLEQDKLDRLLRDINYFKSLMSTQCELASDSEKKVESEKLLKHWQMMDIYARYTWELKQYNFDLNKVYKDIESIVEKKSKKEELKEYTKTAQKLSNGETEDVIGSNDIAIDIDYWKKTLKVCKVIGAKYFINKKYKEYESKLDEMKEKNAKEKVEAKAREKKNGDDNFEQASIEIDIENEVNDKMIDIPELLQTQRINEDSIGMISKKSSNYSKYFEMACNESDNEDELNDLRIKVLKASMEKMQKQIAHQQSKNVASRNHNNNNNNNINNNNMNKSMNNNNTRRDDEMYALEASKGMEIGELAFNSGMNEVNISDIGDIYENVAWHDKYRPRKPRYFNRVKTGYSWNKYNQTHYDPENPPPKIVQGYKFNIFYPDLMDPTVPPTYKIYEKQGDEYATIVFSSGPPYQDIAFKIVNNEIEPNHQRGFRCRFEKGIFSLYFNFKRYRYRR